MRCRIFHLKLFFKKFNLFIFQIQEVANNIGVNTKEEFKTMLEFYHDLGVILYYGGSGSLDSLLRNTIILKPEWLVEMFKRIVTAKPANDKVNNRELLYSETCLS